uniref:Uncharacterized protein n=1 Tax=Anguilla anguilla TaxID=7936 RepID=A0A0E9T4B7_ANGAN
MDPYAYHPRLRRNHPAFLYSVVVVTKSWSQKLVFFSRGRTTR